MHCGKQCRTKTCVPAYPVPVGRAGTESKVVIRSDGTWPNRSTKASKPSRTALAYGFVTPTSRFSQKNRYKPSLVSSQRCWDFALAFSLSFVSREVRESPKL